MQTRTHQTIASSTDGFLTRTLREYRIPDKEESTTPFKEGSGSWVGIPPLWMWLREVGTPFQGKDGLQSPSLTFHATVTDPVGHTTLAYESCPFGGNKRGKRSGGGDRSRKDQA